MFLAGLDSLHNWMGCDEKEDRNQLVDYEEITFIHLRF
jgi:hypothetical protein